MPNVRRCAIIGCDSHSKRNPELSFFRFPHQDSPYYEQWRKACNASLSRILPFKMAYICTLHFDSQVVSGRRLSGQAVPSRNLEVPALFKRVEKKAVTAENERDRRFSYINAVVYEWLIRSNRNSQLRGAITHGMIKEKAEMAKQAIQCEEFIADNRWLNNFRQSHLTDFNKKLAEVKPLGTSLNIPDIVKDLRYRFPSLKIDTNDDDDTLKEEYDDNEEDDADVDADPDPDADADAESENFNDLPQLNDNSATPTPSDELTLQQKIDNTQIKTYKQALDYLKTLEDFVVVKEDFRAINIITQLETVLRKGDRIVNLEVVD